MGVFGAPFDRGPLVIELRCPKLGGNRGSNSTILDLAEDDGEAEDMDCIF